MEILRSSRTKLPILGTKLPILGRQFQNERTVRNGLLVPVKDVLALARAMVRMLSDSAMRERLGKAGRETEVRTHLLNPLLI